MINTKFYTSRSHTPSPNVKRRISEQLAKDKPPTNALSARPPTHPTCLTCPTRFTCPTIAGAARTPTRLTCPTRLTRPSCLTCPTRPTIAGAARPPTCPTRLSCPTRLKPPSLPSPLKPPISFSLIINNLHPPVKK